MYINLHMQMQDKCSHARCFLLPSRRYISSLFDPPEAWSNGAERGNRDVPRRDTFRWLRQRRTGQSPKPAERLPSRRDPRHEAAWVAQAKGLMRPSTVAGGTVDFVGDNRVIFDLGGNKYRLVVHVSFTFGRVLVKFIGTHAEYDRIDPETVLWRKK